MATPRTLRARTDERSLPYIDLLDKVALLADSDRVAFERVRANLKPIREWFGRRTGWGVLYTPDCVRLVRPPARALPGHGFAWEREPSPRDYAMMAWVLWYGERENADSFTVTLLAREVQEQANLTVAPGYIDWNVREHRAALRNAIAGLESMRIISHLDGDMRPYVESHEGDALYEFTPLATRFQVTLSDALYAAVVYERAPLAIDRLPPDDDRPEYRCYRTLLLSPALAAADDPEVFAHLKQHRRRIAADLQATFGWTLEVTGAYACVLRPAQDARGRAVFPTQAAETHVLLLLANALRAEVREGRLVPDPEHDTLAVTVARLSQLLAQVAAEHRAAWSAEMAALNNDALTARTLEALRAWGFADAADQYDTIRIQPVLGRYAGVYRADGAGLDVTPDEEEADA